MLQMYHFTGFFLKIKPDQMVQTAFILLNAAFAIAMLALIPRVLF